MIDGLCGCGTLHMAGHLDPDGGASATQPKTVKATT